MKLTPKQIDFVNKEVDLNNAILMSNPRTALFNHIARQEALKIIVELANIRD